MAGSQSNDDDTLWGEVIKSVTPAKRDDVIIRTQELKKTPVKTPVKTQAKKPAPLPGQAKKQPPKQSAVPADLRSFVPVQRAGIDQASARRLTKGAFEIDARLDLHGKTEAQAHRILQQFIQSQSRLGARTLLVITGKGAQGQGLLRKKVPDWLQDYPLKSHVLALSQASPKDGGGGALYVRLRRKRESR